MADPPHTDPADRNPDEQGLSDRSDGPSISPWLILGLILILGAVVYVVSAMTGR